MAPARTFGVNIAGDSSEFAPEQWTGEEFRSDLPKRHPQIDLDVLIVGAGMAGLVTALECWRKGMDVVGILERSEGPVYSGDIIAVMPSAVSFLKHWPGMRRDLENDQVEVDLMYKTHAGKHIYGPTTPSFNDPEHLEKRPSQSPRLMAAQVRERFYRMLLRQVAKVGLKIQYGSRVTTYFEDPESKCGGVLFENGEAQAASVVVAADGIRSRSELLISGRHTPAKSSGMSIYRCSYPTSLALRDETVRQYWSVPSNKSEGQSDQVSKSWEFWLGPGMYMGVFMSPDLVCWGFTPREQHDGEEATESWQPNVDPETVAALIAHGASDWHPAVSALVRTAPAGSIVHWPLLWRDLRCEWTSRGGHVVQAGDSAHTFTPTSGSGATQAIEDAVTLATCLQLSGGARQAPVATKIYNLLRYDRVSCAQKMSFVNAELKTETNWDAIWKDPAQIRTRFPVWIFDHDPEAYAYDKYGQAFAHVVRDGEFSNTNIPPGYTCRPWTIDDLYKEIANGKRMDELLEGDWS